MSLGGRTIKVLLFSERFFRAAAGPFPPRGHKAGLFINAATYRTFRNRRNGAVARHNKNHSAAKAENIAAKAQNAATRVKKGPKS